MKELILHWLRARARQCTGLGFGNDAALFEKAVQMLKGVQPQLFVPSLKLVAVIEATIAEMAAEQKASDDAHEQATIAAAQATPSAPASVEPPAAAPDNPAVPAEATEPSASPEEMAAKFAPAVEP